MHRLLRWTESVALPLCFDVLMNVRDASSINVDVKMFM